MNPQEMLERLFGKQHAMQLLDKWRAMTPEQQQAEMMKVQGMPQTQINQFLSNLGINPQMFGNMKGQQPKEDKPKFNY